MKLTTFLIALFAATTAFSQNVNDILLQIEQNNTTLKATRQLTEAEKIGHRTGLTPNNPEVEFGYQWGNPNEIGNKIEFSVKQEFDFPLAYFYRNDIAKLRSEQSDLEYENARREILLEARLTCCELVFCNQLIAELQQQNSNAQTLAELYQKSFDLGDCSVLEYNKAQLNLLNTSKKLAQKTVEKTTLLGKLQALNGGIFVDFDSQKWENTPIPANFDDWYQQAEENNPMLVWLKKELDVAKKETKLNAAAAAPKLSAGYAMEHLPTEQFQGVMVGISIPLWQDAKKVKYAKAKTLAAENSLKDKQLQFYNELKNLHTQAVLLQKNANDYAEKMAKIASYDLLQKALNGGEITLVDYILESYVYYESRLKIIELQLEFEKIAAKLKSYTLF